jgi:sorbose reductase
MAETSEMIGPVIFLLSPAANYINGHNMVVDGGFTSW